MGDGSPIFRLEVLDPQNCTQFKLAELSEPWWPNIYMDDINDIKEYDFPFYDFGIEINDVFNFEKLI